MHSVLCLNLRLYVLLFLAYFIVVIVAIGYTSLDLNNSHSAMFLLVTVLVMLVPLGSGEGRFWDKGSEEDLVFENLGLKAEKIGMISLVDEHALISVLIKLPNFEATAGPNTDKERGLIDTLLQCSVHVQRGIS